MKSIQIILRMMLVNLLFVQVSNGQVANSYVHSSEEFDETRFRTIASAFGYSEELIDSFVVFQQEQIVRIKSLQLNQQESNQQISNQPPSSTCAYCVSATVPFSTNFPPYYDNNQPFLLTTEPDYFENVLEPFKYWLGRLGSSPGGYWAYGDYELDGGRHTIVYEGIDPIAKFPVVAPGSSYSVRLGGPVSGGLSEQLIRRYDISSSDPDQTITYRFAAVIENPDHYSMYNPSLSIKVYAKNTNGDLAELCCLSYEVYAREDIPGFIRVGGVSNQGAVYYKPWSASTLDFGPLYADLINNPQCYGDGTPFPSTIEFYLEFTVKDCMLGGHFGYAYIDGGKESPKITKTGRLCKGMPITFKSELIGKYMQERITWDFGDGVTIHGNVNHEDQTITNSSPPSLTYSDLVRPTHTYQEATAPSTFTIQSVVEDLRLAVTLGNACNKINTIKRKVVINDCRPVYASCEECIQSFAPIPGETYHLSAWVSQITGSGSLPDQAVKFSKPNIQVKLLGSDITLGPFYADGLIIDGWQKVEAEIQLPANTTAIEIILNNGVHFSDLGQPIQNSVPTGKVYFDDIRISPMKSNMKSFVYDPRTQKLMAEMDENNYATFYEYDEEGKLVRIKKETAKGVSTIKEVNANTHRKAN